MFIQYSVRDGAGANPEGQLWWFTIYHMWSSKLEAEVSLVWCPDVPTQDPISVGDAEAQAGPGPSNRGKQNTSQ